MYLRCPTHGDYPEHSHRCPVCIKGVARRLKAIHALPNTPDNVKKLALEALTLLGIPEEARRYILPPPLSAHPAPTGGR